MPRRRRRREKNIFILFYFFRLFFLKNNLAKFWKFWEFLSFFLHYGFHWKSAFQCKVPFRPHWQVEHFLRKKNWIPDSIFFTFFMPKNDLSSIFEPPLFSGRRPKFNLIFGIFCIFFCTYAKKYNLVPPPPSNVGPQTPL